MTPVNRMGMESKPITKPGAKLITIYSGDLAEKSNYQDLGRYAEVDLAIAADAEATLPALIEACKRLITADREARIRRTRCEAGGGGETDAGPRNRTGCVWLGFEPDHHGAGVGGVLESDPERRLVAAVGCESVFQQLADAAVGFREAPQLHWRARGLWRGVWRAGGDRARRWRTGNTGG